MFNRINNIRKRLFKSSSMYDSFSIEIVDKSSIFFTLSGKYASRNSVAAILSSRTDLNRASDFNLLGLTSLDFALPKNSNSFSVTIEAKLPSRLTLVTPICREDL